MKPFLVLEQGNPSVNVWLIGFTAPIPLGSQAEVDAMVKRYGPVDAQPFSKGTIDQMTTGSDCDHTPI